MISREEYLEYYWLPYTLCENDFLTALEYVALRPSNLSASSERLIRLLLSSCELFEALMKQMYEERFKGKRPKIRNYMGAIIHDDDFEQDQRIVLKRGIDVKAPVPFEAAGNDGSNIPTWWIAHNSVKHNHSENFEEGSLKNTLNALSALYLANLVFARKVGTYWKDRNATSNDAAADVPNDRSHLFDCPDFETRYHIASRDSYFAPNDEVLSCIFGNKADNC